MIVDATFRLVDGRSAFTSALGATDNDCVWLECRVPVDVAARRAAARTHGPEAVSDADAAVVLLHAGEWEPLADVAGRCLALRTDRAPQAVLAAARGALDSLLRRPR